MSWERRLLDLFDDLEQQAEGLHLAERDAELAERRHAEYSTVDMTSRLHASAGCDVRLRVVGVGSVVGLLSRVGDGWCLVETASGRAEWVVRQEAIRLADGLSSRALSESARPVTARLPLRSALRRIAEGRARVLVHHVDGTRSSGTLVRVGADFAELTPEVSQPLRRPGPAVLPFATLAAVQLT